MMFRPRVVAVDEARELRWLGRLLLPGVFDGEHRFALHPLAEGRTRFERGERFAGLLVPLVRGRLDGDTRRGFDEMNAALKARAQSR